MPRHGAEAIVSHMFCQPIVNRHLVRSFAHYGDPGVGDDGASVQVTNRTG